MLSEDSEPQPDLAILRWREDFYATTTRPQPQDILLIVEIADTTASIAPIKFHFMPNMTFRKYGYLISKNAN